MDFYKWFFLCEGRTPEGLFSFAHIISVTVSLIVLIGLMVFLGHKFKNNEKAINRILLISAIIMMSLYVLEVWDTFFVHFAMGQYSKSITDLTYLVMLDIVNSMPLFLCDIAIFAIPLIAFTRGRIRTLLADFLAIWGIPMGIIGTYLAGNIFPRVNVISFDGLLAIFIHVIPTAVTIFLYVTKIASLKRENMKANISMFLLFMAFVLVYDMIFNPIFGTNFMFFFTGDGTPFDLFRGYLGKNVNTYQLIVYILYALYMYLFYVVYYWIMGLIQKRKVKQAI